MTKLKRFFEIAKLFGFFSKEPWRILFPPFKGFDTGCYYCAWYESAELAGHCQSGCERGYRKCGVTKQNGKDTQ